MLNLQNLPQEILSDIFARNQDPCGIFAEKMKLISRKCREIVMNRQMDLVDVHGVKIFAKALAVENGSLTTSIVAIVRFGGLHDKNCKSFTNTLKVDHSSYEDVMKKMIEAVLVDKVKSLKRLELQRVKITADLLDQIQHSGIDLMKINTVVMNECEFSLEDEKLYNFLILSNLKNLKIEKKKFHPDLVTDKLLQLPMGRVSISSEKMIQAPQITNHLLTKMMEKPVRPNHHLELKNIKTAIDLEVLRSVMNELGKRRDASIRYWSFGIFRQTYLTELFMDLMRFAFNTKKENDKGMKKYTMNRAIDVNLNQTEPDCRIIFWTKK